MPRIIEAKLPRLRDRIRPDLRLLFVDIKPGVRSALTGHHFAGYSSSSTVPVAPGGARRRNRVSRHASGAERIGHSRSAGRYSRCSCVRAAESKRAQRELFVRRNVDVFRALADVIGVKVGLLGPDQAIRIVSAGPPQTCSARDWRREWESFHPISPNLAKMALSDLAVSSQ
jgi:hypothetical protein